MGRTADRDGPTTLNYGGSSRRWLVGALDVGLSRLRVAAALDRPDDTRARINQGLDAGFRHIVLMLPALYPDHVVEWITDHFITTAT